MIRRSILSAVHVGYRVSLRPAHRRFERAARDCQAAQHSRLRRLIDTNATSAYGVAHGFAGIRSVREWQDRVPMVRYEELEPWVLRAAAGEQCVLTQAPVRVFERTSGSTSPGKLVPYTDALLAEFGAATGAWLHDLYRSVPALRGTRAYWSLSPVTRAGERTSGGIPIGFDDDTQYFGRVARLAIGAMLAVPTDVARIPDIAGWRRATVRHLANADDLGLISVWHPSFLTLLLREMENSLDEILAGVPPARARAIRARMETHTLAEALWPKLAVVSCWADGASTDVTAALGRSIPHARVQPKGLLATEGAVSFPLQDGSRFRNVAAVTSHFLEFVDLEQPGKRPLLAHELIPDGTYSPVISTGGGFYRYRLGDAVRCEGYFASVPVLRFMGRVDQVSDICGEKLNPVQVGAALEQAAQRVGAVLEFALVVARRGIDRMPPHYRLYAEAPPGFLTCALGEALEHALCANPGYEYARRLGQLGVLDVVPVVDGAMRYQRACIARGMRIGDIKPVHFDARVAWDDVFGAAHTGAGQVERGRVAAV